MLTVIVNTTNAHFVLRLTFYRGYITAHYIQLLK